MDFFLGGFLASRLGAFLFPMSTASHRFEDDARGEKLKSHLDPIFRHIQIALQFWTLAASKGFASVPRQQEPRGRMELKADG